MQGYFDQKTYLEQLGLQIIPVPQADLHLSYGYSVRMPSGKRTKPGAFSMTWIDVRSGAGTIPRTMEETGVAM